jgi:chromosome segregation ATPase
MIDRADGTYMKLQDSLKQKNVDQQKAKQLIDTLEAKIKELKKEIQYLKEKAIRQGCPGVYF